MAEYCNRCADKFGFESENNVTLCEGYRKYLERVEKDWSKFLEVVLVIIGITLLEILIRYFYN